MNTLKISSVIASVGLLTVPVAGPAAAFGGGPAGASTGAGSGAAGGGHGGGISTAAAGSSHGGFSGGSHLSAGAGSPAFHSMAATYSGAPHYLPGGFAPGGVSRSSYAGRPASQIASSHAVTATQAGNYTVAAQARVAAPSRPANSWTDPVTASPSSAGIKAADRGAVLNAGNQSAAAYRNYISNGNYNGLTNPDGIAGSYLYPGAYGSALNGYYNGFAQRGALATNGPLRNYALANHWYGPNAGYHPYWPNGYNPYFGVYGYPFFGSTFGYGYDGGFGNDAGLTTDNGTYPNDQSVATMDPGTLNGSQPAAQPNTGAQNPPATVEPASPASQDQSVPSASSGASSNGPDSLIEAVQAELGRRGYFSGKVNAMYGPATRDALRRFQADAGLAATGRINEATLHALELD